MEEKHPEQVVKVWELSNSDNSNELLIQKYGMALSFICLSLFGAI